MTKEFDLTNCCWSFYKVLTVVLSEDEYHSGWTVLYYSRMIHLLWDLLLKELAGKETADVSMLSTAFSFVLLEAIWTRKMFSPSARYLVEWLTGWRGTCMRSVERVHTADAGVKSHGKVNMALVYSQRLDVLTCSQTSHQMVLLMVTLGTWRERMHRKVNNRRILGHKKTF